jgi:hypothetical protein
MLRDPKNDWPFLGALLLVALGLFVAAAVCSGAVFFDWLAKDAITVYTAVLALLTVGLVWVGYTQRQQLERTAEHMTATERAYVFPAFRYIVAHHRNGGYVDVLLEAQVINHGRTPAVLQRIRAYPHVSDNYPDELVPATGSQDIPPGKVLASADSISTEMTWHGTATEWANIQAGNTKLCCVGEVRYRDIHRAEQVTGFCWELHWMKERAWFEIAPTDKLNHYT